MVDVVFAGTGMFFPPLLVDLVVVVVDMAVSGLVDAAVCGVAIADFSDEPSEMETALVPPQPHMKPRAFFLMHSTRPAPRRRDRATLMEGFCSGGVGAGASSAEIDAAGSEAARRGWWVLRKEKAVVCWRGRGGRR